MDNNHGNSSSADFDDVKSLLDRERRGQAPVSVRLTADICLLLLSFSFSALVIYAMMTNSPLPTTQLIVVAMMIVLLLGYRKAKKWGLLSIGGLYMISLGMWLFSIYRGAPPEFGELALSSVIPIALLAVGALSWKHFS
jgi:hypothetical protein